MRKLKRFVQLFAVAFAALLALPLAVLAAEVAVEAAAPFVWWQFLLALFTNLVMPVLGTVLAVLATAYAGKLLKKVGLDSNKVTDDLVTAAATKATAFVDEWAKKKLKDGEMPKSAEKLTVAVTKAREFLVGTGLDKIAEKKLIDYLEAQLNINRVPAAATVVTDPSQ